MEDLKKLRSALKAKITRFQTFLEKFNVLELDNVTNSQVLEIENRLQVNSTLLAEFDLIHNEILKLSKESETEFDYQTQFENSFFNLNAIAQDLLTNIRSISKKGSKSPSSSSSGQKTTAEKSSEKSSIKEQAPTSTASDDDITDTETTNVIIVNEEKSTLLSPQKTQTASSASTSNTETLIVEDDLQISNDSAEDSNVRNDPAEWHIANKNLIIDLILKNPPRQNIDELDFNTSVRNYVAGEVRVENCTGKTH
ncbi:hypothetical protein RN001_012472 [Aquatica leii]|uniref:Uncharacterized protein n=1 Tax=Aquatica leii TaxID=1421715 RepID=A0AAN7Q1M7_9COLE|nr:hypothetical protein RN001_012472 [Aquatica leii]